MKLKKDYDKDILYKLDNEGFWYALREGYLKPEDVLEDEKDAEEVEKAMEILEWFDDLLTDAMADEGL